MFKFENVSKSYSKSSVRALDNLTMEVENGEIFGFLGPNGAGKTTTIKLLCGIINPDSVKGSISSARKSETIAEKPSFKGADEPAIYVDGYNMSLDPIGAKKQLSFVPDTPELFSHLKASEYLNFIGDVYEVPSGLRQKRVEKYAELFGIKEDLNSRISSFSHGMKQKLFLTASLISDPQNWILDEPMIGLDPEAAFNLKELMRQRAAAGKLVFFSTHVMEVAEKLCTKIGIIKKGSLIFTGTLEELRAQNDDGSGQESLEDIFLRITGMHTDGGTASSEEN